MASFSTCLEAMRAQIEEYAPLQAYCSANLGGSATVLAVYPDTEDMEMLKKPVIFLARPEAERMWEAPGVTAAHAVTVTAGFRATSKDDAVADQIQFEELIEDAIIEDPTLSGHAMDTRLQGLMNSEGELWPLCFSVLHFEVIHRRSCNG